jgi:hypothetical protein
MCVFMFAVTMPDGHVLDLLVKYVGEQEQLSSLEVDVSTDTCVCLFGCLSVRLCECLFVYRARKFVLIYIPCRS